VVSHGSAAISGCACRRAPRRACADDLRGDERDPAAGHRPGASEGRGL